MPWGGGEAAWGSVMIKYIKINVSINFRYKCTQKSGDANGVDNIIFDIN